MVAQDPRVEAVATVVDKVERKLRVVPVVNGDVQLAILPMEVLEAVEMEITTQVVVAVKVAAVAEAAGMAAAAAVLEPVVVGVVTSTLQS